MYIRKVVSTTLASGYFPTIDPQHPVFTLPSLRFFTLLYNIQRQPLVGTVFSPCVEPFNDATYRHRSMRALSFTLLAVLSYVAVIGATHLGPVLLLRPLIAAKAAQCMSSQHTASGEVLTRLENLSPAHHAF